MLASLYVLVMVLDPTDVASEYIFGGFTDTFDTDAQYWGNLIFLLFYMVAVWIVEPLYVAGSFSLYLNRRTQLEAWDIELAFRNLGERLSQLARLPLNLLLVTLMITGSVASLSPVPAYAAEAVPSEYLSPERLSPPESAQQIGEIMQSEELSGMHTRKVWMPREQDQDTPEDSAAWVETLQLLVANITKIALWIGVIVLLVMAFVYRQRILALLKPARRKLPEQRPPDILFGMDIRPESLPDDIASACRKLWETGQHREALSLLYRAALMRLTRHERLAIQDSHTEGDILQLARPHLSAARMVWLTAVTHVWQEIAYAHRIPEDAQVIPLFEAWTTHSHGRSMNLQRILIGIFAALVAVAIVLLFLNTFELKEIEEHTGFRGEAKTNPLFAARLFLKRMGIPAERKDRLANPARYRHCAAARHRTLYPFPAKNRRNSGLGGTWRTLDYPRPHRWQCNLV